MLELLMIATQLCPPFTFTRILLSFLQVVWAYEWWICGYIGARLKLPCFITNENEEINIWVGAGFVSEECSARHTLHLHHIRQDTVRTEGCG